MEGKATKRSENQAEGALPCPRARPSEAILSAVSRGVRGLFGTTAWDEVIVRFLGELGVATDVSRVYLFENHLDKRGTLLTSQRYEWVQAGIPPQIDNPELKDLPWEARGFDRWMEELGQGRPVYGFVRDFPESERRILEAQDILSIAVVPIFVKQKWWGFLGFDECTQERVWTGVEIDTLRIASDVIGAAIELRLEQKELRESEEKYKTLVEHSFDGIYIHKGPRIIFANKRIHEMLGYDDGELLGREFWSIYHPDYQELVKQRAQARRRGENPPAQYEVIVRRKDGSYFFAELSIRMIEMEGEPAFHVWLRDITEKKESEKALREAEAKYRSIFENAMEGIFQSTLDGRFITANPALAKIHGYNSPEELISEIKDIATQIYVDPAQRQEFIRRIREGEYLKGYEVKAYRKDGSIVHTSVDAHGVKDGDGNLLYIEGFIEDVTEKKRSEEERKKLEAEYRHAQKMEAVGTLAGGIAHDFNNLLQGIMGYTEILLLDKKEGDPDLPILRQIARAARRASELTQQLLTFSRKVETRPRPVNLNQEIRQVLKLLERTLPKMIHIEVHLAEDLANINADPAQIEQVLMNLAVNARDAMQEGGKLIIDTENVVLDEEYCSRHVGARPGQYVLLSVTDTGCGMDEETVEHIFEPFFTTKKQGRGTGLGLSMVYGIVKSHGGYIMCYSELGCGTTFKIYLPALEAKISEEDVQGIDGIDIKRGNETILIVDDEEIVRSLAEQLLKKFGYKILTAQRGEECLEIYRKRGAEISLIILDLIMPGMGGKRCLEEILKLDPCARVIIASGYSANGPVRDLLNQGARAFVRKPFVLKELLGKVREVLDE